MRPVWPGQAMTALWGAGDPVAVEGDELAQRTAFASVFREFHNCKSIFFNLPVNSLDTLRLQEKLDEIGQIRLADTQEPAA